MVLHRPVETTAFIGTLLAFLVYNP